MKNEGFSLRFVFTDFIILTLLFLTVSSSVFGGYRLLYRDAAEGGRIIIITEPMPLKYERSVESGDVIYDPITKRKIGEAGRLEALKENESVRFLIELDAVRIPRGDSLRTKRLWFRYEIKE